MSSMIENFDSLARLLLEALLNTLWQGMLIAGLVWLLLRIVHRLSATTRHAVWLVTLLTIGTLPLLAVVANRNDSALDPAAPGKHEATKPSVHSGTPAPANHPNGQEADPSSINRVIARLNAPANQGKAGGEVHPPSQVQEENLTQRRVDDGAGASTVDALPTTAVVTATKTLDSPRVENTGLWLRLKSFLANAFGGPVPLAMVGIWLALWGLMSWRVARSYRAVFHLRGRLEPAPSEQSEHVERLASMFGVKRRVRTFTSGQVAMPMTIGSLNPLIILPTDLGEELSQSEFESVVAHELAHIKRWDYLTNLLQRVVQSYLFFHPAVWFICKQLTIERELACDDWAIKTCEPRRYASCLTKLVEALNESKPHMAVRVAATGIGGIVFGKHVISRRVEMILNRDRNATTAVSKPALLYAIGLVVMFVAVCSLISPVIAVPLGQNPAKQSKKENKAAAPAKSQELPQLPPVPPLPPELLDVTEPQDIPAVPEIPEQPEAPLPTIAQLTPDADLAAVTVPVQPALPAPPAQSPNVWVVAPPAPEAPTPSWGSLTYTTRAAAPQDDKSKQPTIPETELLGLLVDIVKRDADPNVRQEALQGIYRLRSDASINALIQLYDSSSDLKIKGEIIPYLLRREGRESKVDNGKAVSKLVAIAKSEQNEELRNKAVRYLGNVRGDEGADVLIQIYDGLQDQKMKQYVIRSLAQNRGRKAVDKLIQIAKNDSDPVVRQFAIRSLYNVDSRHYLELIDKDRTRVGMADGKFLVIPTPEPSPRPFVFKHSGEPFEFDAKKWEDWQKDWNKNWEEQNEKMREMIEKLQFDGKFKFENFQNNLRIEIPKIELQIKDLQDKIRLGYEFNNVSAVEDQLRLQLANVEAQIATMRANYADTHPKMMETRYLRDALERQANSLRLMRRATPRPGPIRDKRAISSPAPVVTPKGKATTVISTSSL